MTALRVLVADDNRDAADSLAALLELWGHEVSVAYDGVDALRAAGENSPTIVFLDMQMPKLNGGQVARRLRQYRGGRALHIIALTALEPSDLRLREYEDAFDAYLRKPYDARDLASIVGRAAEQSE